MKNKFGDLFIQIISVMIGVFLGFAVSNWAAQKKTNTQLQYLEQNIISEIKINQQKVTQVIDYHRTLRDSSRFYLQQERIDVFKPNFFRGVNTLTLSNSAFETGIQTGLINDIPLQQIQELNEVYTQQRAYEDFANLLLSGLITMDFEGDEMAMRKILLFLSVSMTDVVIKEEQLLESYKKAIQTIENTSD